MILELEQIALGMETNGIPLEVVEALTIQPAGEPIRIACLEIIEELKRIHIREILIRGCNQLAAGASRNRRFDVRCKQTKARLLDEADRKAKRTAGINVLLQLVYEFNFAVIGVKVGFHTVPRIIAPTKTILYWPIFCLQAIQNCFQCIWFCVLELSIANENCAIFYRFRPHCGIYADCFLCISSFDGNWVRRCV